MKKMSRKLTVAILSVAFAFVALGATTFAWFTLTNTVTVSQFSAKVTTGSGFEVSIDDNINGLSGGNYYSNLPNKDIIAALDALGVNKDFSFDHITSPDGKEFQNIFKNLTGSAADKGYIDFKLKFRSLDENTVIYLGKNTALTSEAKEWTPDVDFLPTILMPIKEDGQYKKDLYNLAYAARMSFTGILLEEEIVGEEIQYVPYTKTTVYQLPAGILGENNGKNKNTQIAEAPIKNGAVDYYDVKNNLAPENGLIVAKWYLYDENDQPVPVKDAEDKPIKVLDDKEIPFVAIVEGDTITLPTGLPEGFRYFASDEFEDDDVYYVYYHAHNALPETVDFFPEGEGAIPVVILNTKEDVYFTGVVTIRIWIEGWDPDCFDSILLQQLMVDLQFVSKQ